MARGDLTCPIDGLALGLPSPQLKGDVSRDSAFDQHMHLDVDVIYTCANGHKWRVYGNLLAERTR